MSKDEVDTFIRIIDGTDETTGYLVSINERLNILEDKLRDDAEAVGHVEEVRSTLVAIYDACHKILDGEAEEE